MIPFFFFLVKLAINTYFIFIDFKLRYFKIFAQIPDYNNTSNIDANASSSHNSVFDDYVRACKLIIFSLSNCLIFFVRCSANVLAHEFVKASRSYKSPHSWNELSDYVVGLPNFLCSSEPLI